jgi:hypothetical protein
MATRRIPIHSFYIEDLARTYFNDVSRRTLGESKEYMYQEADAPKLLTDFIVENILNKIGGEAMGIELIGAYRLRFKNE